jgi:hypothetical protein
MARRKLRNEETTDRDKKEAGEIRISPAPYIRALVFHGDSGFFRARPTGAEPGEGGVSTAATGPLPATFTVTMVDGAGWA